MHLKNVLLREGNGTNIVRRRWFWQENVSVYPPSPLKSWKFEFEFQKKNSSWRRKNIQTPRQLARKLTSQKLATWEVKTRATRRWRKISFQSLNRLHVQRYLKLKLKSGWFWNSKFRVCVEFYIINQNSWNSHFHEKELKVLVMVKIWTYLSRIG